MNLLTMHSLVSALVVMHATKQPKSMWTNKRTKEYLGQQNERKKEQICTSHTKITLTRNLETQKARLPPPLH